jgi:hypothetical protein
VLAGNLTIGISGTDASLAVGDNSKLIITSDGTLANSLLFTDSAANFVGISVGDGAELVSYVRTEQTGYNAGFGYRKLGRGTFTIEPPDVTVTVANRPQLTIQNGVVAVPATMPTPGGIPVPVLGPILFSGTSTLNVDIPTLHVKPGLTSNTLPINTAVTANAMTFGVSSYARIDVDSDVAVSFNAAATLVGAGGAYPNGERLYKTGGGTIEFAAAGAVTNTLEELVVENGLARVSTANDAIASNGVATTAAVDVRAGAVFEVARVSQTLNTITGAGIISLDMIPGVTTVPTGANTDTNLILSNAAAPASQNLTFTGNIIGTGSLGFVTAGTARTLTLSGNNTYASGTYIAPNSTLRIRSTPNIGTGVVHIAAGGTLNLTEGSHALDNIFRISGPAAVIDVAANARLTLTNTVGYVANGDTIQKAGDGELILAGPGYAPQTPLNGEVIVVDRGIVRLANNNAIDHARITASMLGGVRATNGLLLPGTPSGGGTPLAASARVWPGGKFLVEVGADNKTTAPQYVPAATIGGIFVNSGGYDLYVIPKGDVSISSDDEFLAVRATTAGTNFSYGSVTVKDLAGNTLTNFKLNVSNDVTPATSTLKLIATTNFDVPTFTNPPAASANASSAIVFRVPIVSQTTLAGTAGSFGIYGLPNEFTWVFDRTGKEFTVTVPAGTKAAVYPFTAFATSEGNADVAGITGESEELSFEVTATGGPIVDAPYTDWTWSVSGTTSNISGSVVLQNKHTDGTPATNVTGLTNVSLTLDGGNPITLTPDANGSYAIDIAGVFYAGDSHTLAVTSTPAYAGATTSSTTVTIPSAGGDAKGGSGGGGCDAGFGLLSLLAAGAFVTLRKKG